MLRGASSSAAAAPAATGVCAGAGAATVLAAASVEAAGAARGAMFSAAAVPAAAGVWAGDAAQLADKVTAMEKTCIALNERLATIRTADQAAPLHDEQQRKRERERVERELQRQSTALIEANGAAAKAAGLVEHYKSQTEELRRSCTRLQAHVWEETAPDSASGSQPPRAAAPRTEIPSPHPLSASAAFDAPTPDRARATGPSSAPSNPALLDAAERFTLVLQSELAVAKAALASRTAELAAEQQKTADLYNSKCEDALAHRAAVFELHRDGRYSITLPRYSQASPTRMKRPL